MPLGPASPVRAITRYTPLTVAPLMNILVPLRQHGRGCRGGG
jgi:hypothetical protein